MQIQILRKGKYVTETIPQNVSLMNFLLDCLPLEALQPDAGVPEAGYYWREVK